MKLSAKALAPAGSGVHGAGALREPAERAFLQALDSLGDARWLDPVIKPMRYAVRRLPLGRFRDVLHGRPIGHPLHPVLVQLPMGCWLSAAVLDYVPGGERAARTLIAVGLASVPPTAVAGWVDWAEQHDRQMRTGLVHAASNLVSVGLYGCSLTARLRGRTLHGRVLGLAGLTVAAFGGMIGGHLAYRQATGANKAEPVAHVVEPGWHTVGRLEDFPVGAARRAAVGEVPVLVVREAGNTVHVLADRCSHASGPLSRGRLADGCVTCPWHGSVFRLVDGYNVGGPATAPQPCFDTRVSADGTVEACLPGAG